jgi:hypothetical protein
MTDSDSSALSRAVATLLREALDGAAAKAAWFLNPGDPGLLASLDRLTAEQASAVPPRGTAPIAAHVEHLRFGLELLNRSSSGANPFEGADWGAAWRVRRVSEDEWVRLRGQLREEAAKWQEGAPTVMEAGEAALTGVLASVVHLAYHLGAIRQIDAAARGPSAEEVPPPARDDR